jgi:parallel beta-helix repeat protein
MQTDRAKAHVLEKLGRRLLFATFYVDAAYPSASDSNSGTSLTAPFKTIQAAVSKAQNNNATSQADTIYIRAGVYRERVGYFPTLGGSGASSRTVLSAYVNPSTGNYDPVYVLASDRLVGTWVRDGSTDRWYLDGFSTKTAGVWVDWSPANDGAPLQQIGSYGTESRVVVGAGVADMTPGSFYHDLTAGRLYVRLADGSDPNAHDVCYARRSHVLYSAGAARPSGGYDYTQWLDVRGLKLRHVNVYEQYGQDVGNALFAYSNQRFFDLDVQWNSGYGASLYGNSELHDSVLSNNGNNGIAGKGTGFLVDGCTVIGNSWRRYTGGVAAGIKVISNTSLLYGDIRNSEFAHTVDGPGIWYDTVYGAGVVNRVTGNYVHDNDGPGIDLEASSDFLIANNVIVNNDGGGVRLNAVENATIVYNTLVGNGGNATIELNGGTRGTLGMRNNQLRNNLLSDNYSTFDLGVPPDSSSGTIANNTSDRNLIYRRGGPLQLTRGGTYLGAWGTTYESLPAWRSVGLQDTSSFSADPKFVGGTGASAYALGSDSPAVNAGAALAIADDFAGASRDASPDIGAFEYKSGATGRTSSTYGNTDRAVWLDDVLPDGASPTPPDATGNTGASRLWRWTRASAAAGALAMDTQSMPGEHRMYFDNARPRPIASGDVLFAWVYIDPVSPPRELMLEWKDIAGSWSHRAYWGENLIAQGTAGTASRRFVGALPAAGAWTLLQVPAAQVGLGGQSAVGLSVRAYDGRALIDRAGSIGASAPAVSSKAFSFDSGQSITLDFTSNVEASLTLDDVSLVNTTTGQAVPSGSLSLSYDPTNNIATLRPATGLLADGRYRLTLTAAGVVDAINRPIASNVTLDFFVLAGDATRDGTVNFDDLLIVAANYQTASTQFTRGDFNYDGVINFDDLLILASRYGSSLPPPAAPSVGRRRTPIAGDVLA